MRHPGSTLVALALLLAGGAAAAREPNEQAARLDKLGKKAYAAKDWDDAVASFEAAFAADPMPRFLFNAGRSYEKKGDVPRAIDAFERYLAKAAGEKDQADAKDRLAILKVKRDKGWGRVRITASEAGAALHLSFGEERVTEKAPFSGWLSTGRWRLVVDAEGFASHEEDLDVSAGDETKVSVTLEAAGSEPVAEAEDEGEAEEEAGPGPASRPVSPPPAAASAGPLPWIVLGAGIALAGGGAAFGVLHQGAMDRLEDLKGPTPVKQSDIDAEAEAATTYAIVADSLFGLGAAAAIGGVLLLLTGGGEDATATPTWWAAPLRTGAGVTVGGRL